MSAVTNWWQERLQARHPLGTAAIDVEGYNWKRRAGLESVDSWPKAVARIALYDDFRFWCEDHTIGTPLCSELHFFVQIAPWVYSDKSHQVKNYWVHKSEPYQGRWIKVKVRRYFIRLNTWDEHADMFFRDTGVQVRKPLGSYDPT